MKVYILVPCLSLHDAVCNDALKQRDVLRSHGCQCEIFAEFCDKETQNISISESELLQGIKENSRDVLIIYHHAVFWEMGERILRQAKCSIHLKYHNITPSAFFKRYDSGSFHATNAGAAQTMRLTQIENITRFVGDSAYNLQDLISLGVKEEKMAVIAPFHRVDDFSQAKEREETRQQFNGNDVQVLFVGRIVPNKGHLHLIETIHRYIKHYGSGIKLHFVGSMALGEPTYFIELERLVNKYRLGHVVNFRQKVDFDTLYTYYKCADAFLVMSEHEGFCVPILEAQYLDVPVIALNRAAVKDTLGSNQVIFDEIDFDLFAASVHVVAKDSAYRAYLAAEGRENFKRFTTSELERQTIDLLSKSIEN